MSNNLSTPDERMIQLMEYAVKNNMASTEGEYWSKIGYQRAGLSNVRKGLQSFRIEHITRACLLTGASADWVLGIDKNMFRERKGKSALQLLKEATAMLEGENKKVKISGTYDKIKEQYGDVLKKLAE